ncbi:MAG TPA: M23 family metallopeptidase [Geobacteraceae bacterium]|nr:M23 family metallopeptidase [Geobacteraceae bacterium]
MKKFLVIAQLLLLVPHISLAARVSPVDNGTVTSGVGWRLDPFGSGKMVYHSGYDIAVPVGTPVHPTQKGTVYFAGPYKGYGNLVVVEHGEGYVTMYGHNSEILVKAGEKVDTDTVIALAGSTGRSTGPHVHYEIRQLPGFAKVRHEKLENGIKTFVMNNIDSIVNNAVQGKGGGEIETILPDDIDE